MYMIYVDNNGFYHSDKPITAESIRNYFYVTIESYINKILSDKYLCFDFDELDSKLRDKLKRIWLIDMIENNGNCNLSPNLGLIIKDKLYLFNNLEGIAFIPEQKLIKKLYKYCNKPSEVIKNISEETIAINNTLQN